MTQRPKNAPGGTDLPPAMRQYQEIKAAHADSLLLFRMGDFYEMFFEDAVTGARELEITLTSRNKGKEDGIPLCGFPFHAAPSYIARLIAKGYKVAVCEQVEDPRQAKGLVQRAVVRVVTPGLVLDPESLDARENNYLAALAFRDRRYGLAFTDISTGEFRIAAADDREGLDGLLAGVVFREILVPDDLRNPRLLRALAGTDNRCRVEVLPGEYFCPEQARAFLAEQFPPEQLSRLDLDRLPAVAAAAGAALRYIRETQRERLTHLRELSWYEEERYLVLDDVAKRNLELFATIAEGAREGSLIHILDATVTPMGARRLRWWLHHPLREPGEINARLQAVADLRERHSLREDLRGGLRRVYDMERLAGRIAMEVAHARDLSALQSSLERVPEILDLQETLEAPLLRESRGRIHEMADLRDLLSRAIAEDPPLTLRDGGIIREGYDAELDRLSSLIRNGREGIAALEAKERSRTGISTLKAGYNSVFGYYLEVTKANASLVPPEYIRKQTLVNAERYITPELKEFEAEVLHAAEKRKEREYDLFVQIRGRLGSEVPRIQETASALADLDALASLAEVAERNRYCLPVVDGEDRIEIVEGRHPVVERMPLPEGFVPNDLRLDREENRFLVITGPNMAGKSTYIRQAALIVLMAQMGSFVPAARARIGVADRIFTRIGAADSLSRGQSTFMVEMQEVAAILRHATPRSLVILDEVGRGTSTFDGLSIAWAVAEHLQDPRRLGARTLFATHYHQLTELALSRPGVRNFHIAVREWKDDILFLRRIVPGGASRSYGIQVAGLAGIPQEIIGRAKEILENLERGEKDAAGQPRLARGKKNRGQRGLQLSLFVDAREAVAEDLRNLAVEDLAPEQVLEKIRLWKEKLAEEGL